MSLSHLYGTVGVLQYGHSDAGGVEHVPPGWNYWVALVRLGGKHSFGKLFPIFT